MTDPVNHPAHYTEHPSGVECIQITEHMGFNLGNAVKYIWRADLKGSAIEDLEKARWYIDRELTKRDHIDAEVVGADVPDFAPGGVVIPEGGCVLTAEQVEDVRTAREELRGYRNFTGYGRSHVNRLIAAVDALFPATEPAEEAPNLAAVAQEPRRFDPADECQNDNHDPGCGCGAQHWMTTPAPAVPAEEETKAEEVCTGSGGHRLYPCVLPDGHAGVHVDRRGLRWNSPASSPVVPAPTETGPWQHRVNGEICVASPASGLPYTIGKFNDHGDFVWHSSAAELPEGFAPFVAAGEKDA